MSKRLRQNGLAPNIITFTKVIAYGFLNDCMYHLVQLFILKTSVQK
jgi:hypothetical protein